MKSDSTLRAMTIWNDSGDSTITWDETNDDMMRQVIEKKMAEGVTFFIFPEKALGFIPLPKRRARNLHEAMKGRAVSVRDEDFARIVAAGAADVRPRPAGMDISVAEQSRDPVRISRSQSVAVRPMAGG